VIALAGWLVISGLRNALSGYLTTIRDTDEEGLGGYQPIVELCNYDYPYDLFFSSTHTYTITVCSGQIHVMDDEGPHHLYGHGDLESRGMPRLVDYFTNSSSNAFALGKKPILQFHLTFDQPGLVALDGLGLTLSPAKAFSCSRNQNGSPIDIDTSRQVAGTELDREGITTEKTGKFYAMQYVVNRVEEAMSFQNRYISCCIWSYVIVLKCVSSKKPQR
jgi:hypothetical protein